jgi:hypothetical protein
VKLFLPEQNLKHTEKNDVLGSITDAINYSEPVRNVKPKRPQSGSNMAEMPDCLSIFPSIRDLVKGRTYTEGV